jgi:hypothetical protein
MQTRSSMSGCTREHERNRRGLSGESRARSSTESRKPLEELDHSSRRGVPLLSSRNTERRPTLCHEPLLDTRVLLLLPRFDDDLAARVREGGCPRCGGRLDVADYPRKPRGGSIELGDDYDVRRSFCCAVEGCRRRRTPPSVRFSAARCTSARWRCSRRRCSTGRRSRA